MACRLFSTLVLLLACASATARTSTDELARDILADLVGIDTCGVGAVPEDPEDDRSHAPNERLRIAAFSQALEYWYRLTRRLAE